MAILCDRNTKLLVQGLGKMGFTDYRTYRLYDRAL